MPIFTCFFDHDKIYTPFSFTTKQHTLKWIPVRKIPQKDLFYISLFKRITMLTRYTYIFTLAAFMLYAPIVDAQGLKDKMASAYQTFLDNGKLTNGIASLTVLDGKTGHVIFSDNAAIGLPTASTMKVITSITALDILGPDYTYKTRLAYTGHIDSLGVLNGDLIITGSGDPTLGSDRFPQT